MSNTATKRKTKKNLQTQKTAMILEHRQKGAYMAKSILKRWRVHIPAEELGSIVDYTICEAAARFDAKHGASFVTFLHYYLKGNLARTIASRVQDSNQLKSFDQSAGYFVEKTNQSSAHPLVSDGSSGLHSNIPEVNILRKEQIERCYQALSCLNNIEREVMRGVFVEGRSILEMSKELGFSRCHLSRKKTKILKRLRSLMEPQRHDSSEPKSKRGRKPRKLDPEFRGGSGQWFSEVITENECSE